MRCFFGKEFEGFLAASACDVSADSYCFCSATPPLEPFGLSLSKVVRPPHPFGLSLSRPGAHPGLRPQPKHASSTNPPSLRQPQPEQTALSILPTTPHETPSKPSDEPPTKPTQACHTK
ncbi:DUF1010 domain-containing protein [Acidovorax sp. 69]|uniref:DUF1010 domain-containing protein n=1 Tax=Acidovorax sp. 69 TaxID=2035202 RepID=UPI0012FD5991